VRQDGSHPAPDARRALNPFELDGYTVPRRSFVGIPIFAIQRNPHLWPEPERFRFEAIAAEPPKPEPLATLRPAESVRLRLHRRRPRPRELQQARPRSRSQGSSYRAGNPSMKMNAKTTISISGRGTALLLLLGLGLPACQAFTRPSVSIVEIAEHLESACADMPVLATSGDGVFAVSGEDPALHHLRYVDGQVSRNDSCMIRLGNRLNRRVPPMYVNGEPVGFC
jgi:hypothetical protein